MKNSRQKVRIGIFLGEGAVVLLLVAAGVGLLRHNLPTAGYCTFVSIPLLILGTEMIYAGLKDRL